MASHDILNALDACITRLAAGQRLEDCLRDYPQFATRLRPLLQAGLLVRQAQYNTSEVVRAQEAVAFRLEQRMQTVFPKQHRPLWRFIKITAGLLLVLSIFFTSATAVAQRSIPGDVLYPLKRLSENARLVISTDDARLERQFNQRRLDEAQRLTDLQREAEITFNGEVSLIDETTWMIAGIIVQVDANIPGSNGVIIGDRVEIDTMSTSDGQLVARSIRLINSREEQTPVIAPTDTPEATITPSPAFSPTTQRPTLTPQAITEQPITPPSTRTEQPALRPPTATPSDTPEARSTVTPEVTQATLDEQECEASLPDGWVSYTIQRGDTLSTLAMASGADINVLTQVNCITNARLIVTGQQIYLPRTPVIDASPIATQQLESRNEPTVTPQSRPNDDNSRNNEQGNTSRDNNQHRDRDGSSNDQRPTDRPRD
ncbi:MAG: LysM peptidoglycan-binding domain-containing protein [Chloroflexi bacterium]|nr:MAG: hypothetical protein CUN54_01615 [Phototrophicales bacterium]RMF79194.1 MAG: LysM peptidoglycan-binding domain-containing protein [Chloroflexota bacterium]